MPERILTEAVPSGPIKGKTLTSEQYEAMLDEYYDDRGWDREGVPMKATIEKLGLAEFLS
jgi:aldehyde:ferredoxin oxidoreductase